MCNNLHNHRRVLNIHFTVGYTLFVEPEESSPLIFCTASVGSIKFDVQTNNKIKYDGLNFIEAV